MAAAAAQATTWTPSTRQEDENYDFRLSAEVNYNEAQLATQRMKSASDDAHHEETSKDDPALLPALEPQDDQWIHRDKLAKIESQELQAAGLYIPRSRAPSKQARDRSRSAMRRGTDAPETRSRKNSASVEQRAFEHQPPSWDLRTPEEIAEAEANAYFISNGSRGGSRIPVAKTSPAPISLDHLERGSLMSESPEMGARSGSASASLRNPTLPAAKRSNPDVSPKKPPTTGATRKLSSGPKAGQRPKTRNGSGGNTRPSTRSGDSPPNNNKQPEGDPPWMINSYKPDPRLPPDQQLLPTVARRLQQEKWEKDGTYGNVYDKEFRPLNDSGLLQPPEQAVAPQADTAEAESAPVDGDWPLRPAAEKSPSIRQGSYSTMPKISDKPPTSPLPSPRPNATTSPMFQPQIEVSSPAAQRPPETKAEPKRGGCGCCVVM